MKARITGKQSAGLLLYRRSGEALDVLLGHPGGPFWRNKDLGSWSIPKGLIAADEVPCGRRLESGRVEKQCVRDEMAAALGPPPIVSGA
jgi:predicted NUDIX family NTP pyrophosphohydrolase